MTREQREALKDGDELVITQLPKIRSFFENPPDLKDIPKITYVSEDFISWREYMDSQDEYHV